MSCPTCGGANREAIGPGFWRCTSVIVDRFGGPGLTDPRLGPGVIERSRVCGAEYQEGGSALGGNPECACHTFAIGRCAECLRYVCGLHSGMIGGRRICEGCTVKTKWASINLGMAENTQKDNASAEGTKSREERIEQLAKIRDPIKRLLWSMWFFSNYTRPDGPRAAAIHCDAQALQTLLPDLWPRGEEMSLGKKTPWDHGEILAWFNRASHGGADREVVIIEKTRRGFFGQSERRVSGWRFPSGSTLWLEYDGIGNFADIAVTNDGRVVYGPSLSPRTRSEGFNARALRELARLCGIINEIALEMLPPSGTRPYDDVLMRMSAERRIADKAESPYLDESWIEAT